MDKIKIKRTATKQKIYYKVLRILKIKTKYDMIC